jgi:hypothetical protein
MRYSNVTPTMIDDDELNDVEFLCVFGLCVDFRE